MDDQSKDNINNLSENELELKWITHNGKTFYGRKGHKAGLYGERCGHDDQCKSNFCENVANDNGGTCAKSLPGNFCETDNDCMNGSCEDGTCRYPDQSIWESDSNLWRWQNIANNLCRKDWEKKWITHNGKRYCGRKGHNAGLDGERCGHDDQCQSNYCKNVSNDNGGICSKK